MVSNGFHSYVFGDRVHTPLRKGRDKLRNVIIVGPCSTYSAIILVKNIYTIFIYTYIQESNCSVDLNSQTTKD